MFSSIRARLTFSHLAVIVVAMGLSGFVLLSLLERYFLQAMEESLLAQARITAQALVPGAIAESLSMPPPASAANTLQQWGSNISLQAQNLAPSAAETRSDSIDLTYLADASLQLSSQLDTRIRILDPQGAVVLDSEPAAEAAALRTDPLVVQAMLGRYATRVEQGGPDAAMHLALPMVMGDRLVGVVYLSQPIRDLTAVIRDMRMRWLASTLIALLLSGVVGLLLSGAIARPLSRLTDAAGAVARGQFDQQVPARSNDEIGRLSQAFNQMTARLQTARQMQSDFVANVSHDLRTPLTVVKGVLETLRAGAVDDIEVRDNFLETMESETDRLIRLVNDLLVLSRADSEALDLRLEPVDMGTLVRNAVGRMTQQARARQLLVRAETASSSHLAYGDPDRIEQILVNLLDNAIKYSHPGGSVAISVLSTQDQTIQVQVRDEGIGIPSEDLPRVGERFYRTDRARSRAKGGSGLGLAIAEALVRAHGGRLWIESCEGLGTTVAFTLPSA